MAQGDEGARGARVERGAARTARCAVGLALLWFWVPWAVAVAHPLERGVMLAPLLATAVFFGSTALAAVAALWVAKRIGTGYARTGDLLAASAGSLGCVIALLAYGAGEAGLALQALAMALLGFAMGLALVRWERSVASVSERGVVACAAALLASWSVLLYALFAGGGPEASLAGLAGVASLAVRPRALTPDAQDVVVTRLLTLQTAAFLKRYAGAFAASGAVTTFALIQFASARFAVVSGDTFLVLLLVAPVFLLVLLCAWLPKREPNFMLAFHLSFVVALLALFPVNPGTPISLNVSVAFCMLWIGSLAGSLLVMGSRVNRALRLRVRPLRPRAGSVLPGRCRGRARGHRVDDDARLRDGGIRIARRHREGERGHLVRAHRAVLRDERGAARVDAAPGGAHRARAHHAGDAGAAVVLRVGSAQRGRRARRVAGGVPAHRVRPGAHAARA